jgi:predicted phage baseplate assembly protein
LSPVPPADSAKEGEPSFWQARSDLLASGPDDLHFVVEMDNDGRAHLRFGNDEFGEQPDAGTAFQASYRIGNGPSGNVGPEAISRLVQRQGLNLLSGVGLSIRNPLPALGGTAAEPVEEVRLYAPHTFRRELQRAITADDYAAIVEREFKDKVQRAAARLRWNGSWYEVLVAVDPLGQEEADQKLLDAIYARLHRYRRIGHDLVVRSAEQVPLDIVLRVCVLPNYLRGHVKAVLLELFSNRILPDGSRGFFHPDNLTFGEGIYLSKLIAAAQAITGVESVQMTKLRRYKVQMKGKNNSNQGTKQVEPDQAILDGILRLDAFEVARLDNDPSFPENGILELEMGGGR